MRSVTVEALENELEEYLGIAAAGEVVLVTRGGRIVAELTPPQEGWSVQAADVLLADALRNGWITPRTAPFDGPPPSLPVAPTAETLRELDADRADR